MRQKTREFHVRVMKHTETGLLVAECDQLRGLIVHGRTPDELRVRVPQALRAILEAKGETVGEIDFQDHAAPGFESGHGVAQVALGA